MDRLLCPIPNVARIDGQTASMLYSSNGFYPDRFHVEICKHYKQVGCFRTTQKVEAARFGTLPQHVVRSLQPDLFNAYGFRLVATDQQGTEMYTRKVGEGNPTKRARIDSAAFTEPMVESILPFFF